MQQSIHDLSDFKGVSILSGKKYSLIVLENLGANLVENNARHIFAKVPGITAMEMDGSGVQVNIGSRGLSPHRSMEFNVNQNGININSDLFGYPEVHYNPPMEAVGKI
jgi:Fe(3+) dicitrate transport protein